MQDRLNSMRVFAHVVEAKSFSAAADKLGMSKSLASRHVSSLEQALSVKLLQRSTRRLSLTEAGATFYEHCAKIVKEAALAEQRLVEAQSEPAGLVKITALPAFAVRHLVPALAELRRKWPMIRINLSCSNRVLDPGDEGFDLGIRASRNPPPNLVARKLAANRGVLCATPAYLAQHGTPRRLNDLAKHECILFSPVAPKGVWTVQRGRRKYQVKIAGSLETDEMEAVRSAVMSGLGLGVLPMYMVDDASRQGQLRSVLPGYGPAAPSSIYLVYVPNRTLSLRVRTVIDFLVGWFSPIPPWERRL